MARGHLHQSLVERPGGRNAFVRAAAAPSSTARAMRVRCRRPWASAGCLLAHARGTAVPGTPTINGFGCFRPNALALQAVLWGRDNRGAMLRVIGGAGDGGKWIENRVGEAMANPWLYVAAQIHAGLDGLQRGLSAPPATESPNGDGAVMLPTTLRDALQALRDDEGLVAAFGAAWIDGYVQIKQSELARHAAADDRSDWERRE